MRDRDLRASLLARGPLLPAYEYAGELVDGRRRQLLCTELDLELRIHVCESLHEACSTLFPLHPERALALAKSEGTSSLLELAELCGTTPTSLARLAPAPKKSHKRAAKDATSQARSSSRMLRRIVTFEPELYELAKEAARDMGHGNFAKLVRDAVWRAVKDRRLDGAPTMQPHRVLPANGARRRVG